MSEIGDELRKVADEWDVTPLYAIADRVDAEMVELPRGKDGKPIRVGDTVFGEDDKPWHVQSITIGELSTTPSRVIRALNGACERRYLKPEWLTHKCPDSWAQIAYELDAWCDRTDVDGDACGEPRELARRIRRLAEKEDGQ